MILDIDLLISFLKKNTPQKNKKEMGEQDAPAPDSGGSTTSSGGGGSVPKWADVVGGPQRSKANMLGKGGEKWSSGMNRGVANQIW